MRIISGKHKGKKILKPLDKETRPLKDLAKESIFNIIQHSKLIETNIKEAHILDLFSGVGSFGLECLSRGASSVVFIENYKSVLNILKKNIKTLHFENVTEVIDKDITSKNDSINLDKKFDIIFIDPPFKKKNIDIILNNLYKNKLLKKTGIIIIHKHKKDKEEFTEKFNLLIEKSYGISKIIFGNYF